MQAPVSSESGNSVEEKVRREQMANLFAQTRSSNGLKAFFGGVVFWWLMGDTPLWLLCAWYGPLLAICIARVKLDRDFQLASDWSEKTRIYGFYRITSKLDAALIGFMPIALSPSPDSAIAITLSAATVGTAALAFVITHSFMHTSIAYCSIVLIPNIVWQAASGGAYSNFLAASGAIFLLALLVEAPRAARRSVESMRLRYQFDQTAAERQQALELAEHHSEVKSRFLANMSHEMRTPLHTVLSVAESLEADARAAGNFKQVGQISMLRVSGEHVLSVINDVLDIAALEKGRISVRLDPFELVALLEQVMAMCRVSTDLKGLALRLESSVPAPCWVLGDSARIRQVLLNLVGNAVKFTSEGSIRVTLDRGPGHITKMAVIDSGPGIPSDEQELIFHAFHQVDGSLMREHGGVGLGLSISRELARQMGGELTCVSEPSKGSTFVFSLSLPDVAAPAEKLKTVSPAVLKGRVLLAEDDRLNAYLAESLLLEHGLDVDIVENGQQAVDFAKRNRYDLILMDCQMPLLDGIQAARQIRSDELSMMREPVPMVALTANAMKGDRDRALAAGMNDHLAKPFTNGELIELAGRMLATKQGSVDSSA